MSETKSLKKLEQQHKQTNDPETLNQAKEARGKIEEILLEEVERKARFTKQTFYEGGPAATKNLADT